jgi:hypothetical protein
MCHVIQVYMCSEESKVNAFYLLITKTMMHNARQHFRQNISNLVFRPDPQKLEPFPLIHFLLPIFFSDWKK